LAEQIKAPPQHDKARENAARTLLCATWEPLLYHSGMDKETKSILLSSDEVRKLEAMVLALESMAECIHDILARGQASEKD